jgi:hypothetical protein
MRLLSHVPSSPHLNESTLGQAPRPMSFWPNRKRCPACGSSGPRPVITRVSLGTSAAVKVLSEGLLVAVTALAAGLVILALVLVLVLDRVTGLLARIGVAERRGILLADLHHEPQLVHRLQDHRIAVLDFHDSEPGAGRELAVRLPRRVQEQALLPKDDLLMSPLRWASSACSQSSQ